MPFDLATSQQLHTAFKYLAEVMNVDVSHCNQTEGS